MLEFKLKEETVPKKVKHALSGGQIQIYKLMISK